MTWILWKKIIFYLFRLSGTGPAASLLAESIFLFSAEYIARSYCNLGSDRNVTRLHDQVTILEPSANTILMVTSVGQIISARVHSSVSLFASSQYTIGAN